MQYPMSEEWRARTRAYQDHLDRQREAHEAAVIHRFQLAFREAAAATGVIVTHQKGRSYQAALAPGVTKWPSDDWHIKAEGAAFDVMAAERRAREIAEIGEGSDA